MIYEYNGADGGNSRLSDTATYTFNGYYDAASGGTKYYNADVTSAKNWDKTEAATLYAQWTPNSIILPTPTKTGCTFGGWYSDVQCNTPVGAGGESYTPTESKALYAKWTANSYTLTYNYHGATGAVNKSVTYNAPVGTLPAPTRSGYSFVGWFTAESDGTQVTADTVYQTAADSTIHARWMPAYSITYMDGSNTISGLTPTSYTTGAAVTLPTPTKSGYTFAGWYDNAAFTGTAVTSIAADAAVNKTFYAKWTANGGGSTTPTTPTTTLPASGSVQVSATVSGGTAKVMVPQAQLEAALTGGETNVTVDLSGRTDVTNIELSGKTLQTIGEAGAAVTIKTANGAVTLDAATLRGLASSGETVKLAIEPASIKLLTKTEQGMVGTRPVLSLTVAVGATQVKNFDGSVTVTVPYEKAESERAEGLCVWFLDGGKISKLPASYDAKTNAIVFTTPHFSTYVIGYFPFTDVADSAWYYGDAAYAYINGLFSGTSETEFAPEAPMTRAMLWTVLARFAGINTAQSTNINYYDAARAWAMENGITDGTNPDGEITREQLVTILWRYAKLQKLDVSVGENTNILSYDDAFDIAEYAIPAMQWACGAGIVSGSGAALMPRSGATRAQVAAMLHRFAESTEA